MSEEAVRFGPWRSLVGVRTDPAQGTDADRAPAVLFLNSGLLHHVGPHRLHVNLARRLARAGRRSLRFDLSGIGDSGPRQDQLGRDESMVRETQDAMELLSASHGVERFVLFGICTGADQAVRVALQDARVAGAVLVDGYAYETWPHYLRYYLGRLARPHSWWNVVTLRHPAVARRLARLRGAPAAAPATAPATAPASTTATATGQGATAAPAGPRPGIYFRPPRAEAEARLRTLAERGCRLCCVFTPTTKFSHASQFGEMYPSLRGHPAIRVAFLPDANHVFTLLASQQAVMQVVEDWLVEAFPVPRQPERAPQGTPARSGA